jgi:hypothetical protein
MPCRKSSTIDIDSNIITSSSTSVISSTFAVDVGGGLGDGEPFDITRQHFGTTNYAHAYFFSVIHHYNYI